MSEPCQFLFLDKSQKRFLRARHCSYLVKAFYNEVNEELVGVIFLSSSGSASPLFKVLKMDYFNVRVVALTIQYGKGSDLRKRQFLT